MSSEEFSFEDRIEIPVIFGFCQIQKRFWIEDCASPKLCTIAEIDDLEEHLPGALFAMIP